MELIKYAWLGTGLVFFVYFLLSEKEDEKKSVFEKPDLFIEAFSA